MLNREEALAGGERRHSAACQRIVAASPSILRCGGGGRGDAAGGVGDRRKDQSSFADARPLLQAMHNVGRDEGFALNGGDDGRGRAEVHCLDRHAADGRVRDLQREGQCCIEAGRRNRKVRGNLRERQLLLLLLLLLHHRRCGDG